MLDRGLTLLRIRGIPVRLDFTLMIFLPYAAYVGAQQYKAIGAALDLSPAESALPAMAWGVILAVALFFSVLVHELAHALVGLRAGARIRSITLMMLGGVTLMEKEVRPEREAWMAFVGPLTSAGLAALGVLAYRLVPLPPSVAVAVAVFAGMNGVLAVFNLLPAFPMDGGRVLRGLLARPLGRERATRIATGVGRVMAVIFGLYGLVTLNLILVFIAWFVYAGASAERGRLAAHDALEGIPVAQFMTDRLGEAELDEPAASVARRLFERNLVGAKVLGASRTRPLGVVTAWDLAARASAGGLDVPIRTAMRVDLPRVHPEDDAAEALEALASGRADAGVVVDESDDVVGLVTALDLERAVALGAAGRRPPG